MTEISFLHSGMPINCISPNIIVEAGMEQLPGMAGTGFIARHKNRLFYVTARHCLTKNDDLDIGIVSRGLRIPVSLNSDVGSDCLEFDKAISVRHKNHDIPGLFLDLVVLSIATPLRSKERKQLLSRAVKLPPTGDWLDRLFANPIVQEDINSGRGPKFTVIGYPYSGTDSMIIYPENCGGFPYVDIKPAKFHGYLAQGDYPDRYKLTGLTWKHDLNGFSGSPVFVAYRNADGHQYALAGMIVTGGGQFAQFVKINFITQAIE